jgi:phage terminase large subunit-like protein
MLVGKLPPAIRAQILRENIERKGLREFVATYWPQIDPAPFVSSWTNDAICDHLEAVSKRQIKQLVINCPPGTGKSKPAGALWPAWHWREDPRHKFMFGSFDLSNVTRDARQTIHVVQSPLYRAMYPRGATIPKDTAAGEFYTDQGGYRVAVSPGGKGTGKHVHTQVVDDPLKPLEAESSTETMLDFILNWWDGTLSNRRAHPASEFARLVIMQRLGVGDLSGVCLERGYEHLCIPMRYEPDAFWDRGSSLGGSKAYDPRTEPGQIMIPARFDEATVNDLEVAMGGRESKKCHAQLQQNPDPKSAKLVKKAWLEHTYAKLPDPMFWSLAQTWDFNVKGREKAGNSRVAGLLFALFHGKILLLDYVAEYWDWVTGRDAFLSLQLGTRTGATGSQMWRNPISRIYIEDKANGSPLLNELAQTEFGLRCEAVEPIKGFAKSERFELQTPKLQAGLVEFPETGLELWEPFKTELLRFPAKPNDLGDVLEMALRICVQDGDVQGTWDSAARALENIRKGWHFG